ncbi:MAG: hypothetical protein C4518_03350 [Desulfobacteraceae bacterium]|nr:MAG: hypothetical protein C4518_03350 [Desulfobacteraceae bacterium]
MKLTGKKSILHLTWGYRHVKPRIKDDGILLLSVDGGAVALNISGNSAVIQGRNPCLTLKEKKLLLVDKKILFSKKGARGHAHI